MLMADMTSNTGVINASSYKEALLRVYEKFGCGMSWLTIKIKICDVFLSPRRRESYWIFSVKKNHDNKLLRRNNGTGVIPGLFFGEYLPLRRTVYYIIFILFPVLIIVLR